MGEIFKSPLPYDVSKVPNISLPDYLLRRLRNYLPKIGDKPWLVDTDSGKQVMFRDVEEQAKKVASALTKRGFGHGDSLFFVTHDFVNLGILQFAVWMLGGMTRGGFLNSKHDELATQMTEIKCKFVAVDAETAEEVKKAVEKLNFPCGLVNMENAPVENAIDYSDFLKDDGKSFPCQIKINPLEDTVLICNTSGSTGAPKGVLQSHYNFVCVMSSMEDKLPDTHDEDQFVTSNNYSISNTWTAIMLLATGNTMYCMGRFDREKMVQHLLEYKPKRVMMYPYLAGWFARSSQVSKHDFSFVKNILVGGSVLDTTTAVLLQKIFHAAHLNQVYASTETLGVAMTFTGSTKAPLFHSTPEGERLVSSGFLLPLVQAKITDLETGALLGRNQLGRLHILSSHITNGYLVPGGKPADKSSFDAEGWFDSGDMAFFDQFGQLFVRERASFMFKYFITNVHPSELEAVLQEHPCVQMACVLGIPNIETNYLAKAFVVLKKDHVVTKEELVQLVADKLPKEKHLHGGLEFVNSLQVNNGGKVDRAALWRKYCRRDEQ